MADVGISTREGVDFAFLITFFKVMSQLLLQACSGIYYEPICHNKPRARSRGSFVMSYVGIYTGERGRCRFFDYILQSNESAISAALLYGLLRFEFLRVGEGCGGYVSSF